MFPHGGAQLQPGWNGEAESRTRGIPGQVGNKCWSRAGEEGEGLL